MKTRTRLPMLAGIFSLAAVTMPAVAALAVDVTGESIGSSGSAETSAGDGLSIGYRFNLAQSVTVTSLGVLDYVTTGSTAVEDGAGLKDPHDVAIWKQDGTLVASALVPETLNAGSCSSTVATASTAELSSWCFVDITDVVLDAGNYVIGAFYANSGDKYRYSVPLPSLTVASGMTMGGSYSVASNALVVPSNYSGLDYGYFGPNFQVAATTVPEPGSLALLALGLAGIGAVRRRKRAA